MKKNITNLKILAKITLTFLVYFLVIILLRNAYHETNVSFCIAGDRFLESAWWFSLSCVGLTVYYAARTVQKEMEIFKKINQKQRPTDTGANNANPS